MVTYSAMTPEQLDGLLSGLKQEYAQVQSQNLKLDMSRGKPGSDQLDLSMELLDVVDSGAAMAASDGLDTRNYGGLDGIPEAKRLMADLLELTPDEVFIGGTSSLNLMHDCVSFGFVHGMPGGEKPWCKLDTVKFLCPAPGYDRHFAVTEHFGIELVTVPMTPAGPDMDIVEKLVKEDASIKGIWCVPKYSNPQGLTYSDETVRRFAALTPAAPDFRIFWDNAYLVHDLYPDHKDTLLSLMAELKKNGREDMALLFCSTSKVTFSGGGMSAIGASARNMAYIKKHMSLQTICYDKINQLRHVRYFGDVNGIFTHMEKHASILRPKFEMVLDTLESELSGLGIASWTKPNGGYFIALDTLSGCAKRVVALCKEAGVVMTPAGATFPYGVDPEDKNIRIAPTFPGTAELEITAKLFCLCVKIASIEKLLG